MADPATRTFAPAAAQSFAPEIGIAQEIAQEIGEASMWLGHFQDEAARRVCDSTDADLLGQYRSRISYSLSLADRALAFLVKQLQQRND